ncbi:MAG: hypothetical protein ABFD64_10790 [Armatimonadota bacterium]
MRFCNRLVAAAIFSAFLALYLATPTSNYTFDAVNYGHMIRLSQTSGPLLLFHPHHILFNCLGLITWKALGILYPSIDPLTALQVMNSFIGALGLAVFFLILRRLLADTAPEGSACGPSTAVAAMATAAVGLTFGWWAASTDGRPYIPPIAAVLGAFYFAYLTARTASGWTAAGMGLMIAIATLLHQSHALFLVAGAVAIIISPTLLREKLRLSLIVIGVFLPVTIIPYTVVFRLRETQTVSEAVNWALTYARLGVWWNFDVLGNIDADLSGLRHAFLADISAKSAYIPFLSALMGHAVILFASAFVVLGLLDRTMVHVRHYHPPRPRRVYILDGVKGGSFGVPPNPLYVFNILLLVWVVSYSAFFTVWTPGYFVFWIPVAAAWVMILTVNGAARRDRRFTFGVASLAALCFATANLWLYVLPRMPVESNPSIVIARKIRENTPPKSLVIVAGMGYIADMEVYIPYFGKRETISLHQTMLRHGGKGIDRLQQKIRGELSEGNRVYVFGEVFDSPKAWQELTKRYGIKRQDVRAALIRFRPVKRFRVSDQPVYELRGSR